MIIKKRTRDLVEGFKIRRALPSARRRMVGPFIFLDQMGPKFLRAGKVLDMAAHPHIGLAAVTCLFAGERLRRDSLGAIQLIRPGEVIWLTAGSGIAHSGHTPQEMRQTNTELFGIQTWVAFPASYEETIRRSASAKIASGKTLCATLRRSRVSSARYTSPHPARAELSFDAVM